MSSESMTTEVDKKAFEKLIYVKYFERLLLCYDLMHKNIFTHFKMQLTTDVIETVRDWTTIKSFKRLGYKKAKAFYNKQEIKSFVLNENTNSYSLIKYKYLKFKLKTIINAYKI